MDGPAPSTGRNARQTWVACEFHEKKYGGEFVFDELRWSRRRPCLSIVDAERRQKGRRLRIVDVGCGDGAVDVQSGQLHPDQGHEPAVVGTPG